MPGFDQARLSTSRVVLIGAGGLGGAIGLTLVRKGIGGLIIVDPDFVEVTNLNRQRFFVDDVGRNKAAALVRNLVRECTHATDLVGYPVSFEEAVEEGIALTADLAICGVDNNPARTAASRYFRDSGMPVLFVAVSAEADHGYVFVQEPHGPCFACVFPDAVADERYPCPDTPAVSDVLQVVAGFATYAVDTCLMDRPRRWNYRHIGLADGALDSAHVVPHRSNCPGCGH